MATAYPWARPGNEEILAAGQSRESERLKPRLVSRAGHEAAAKNRGTRQPIVEFYTLKKIDNSRLVRHVEPVKMRNLYKTVALGSIIAAFCMLYVYQHFRCIDLGFQLEDLKSKNAAGPETKRQAEAGNCVPAGSSSHRCDCAARVGFDAAHRQPGARIRESGWFGSCGCPVRAAESRALSSPERSASAE